MAKTTNSPPGESPNEPGDENSTTGSQTTLTKVPTASVSDIAGTLISESPEPQPHAIAQAAEERNAAAEEAKDDEGTVFDPSIHTGTKTSTGAWRKRSGRKPGSGTARPKLNLPGGSGGPGATATTAGPESKAAEARATGVVAANLFLMFSVAIGGDEWQPRNENEKPMLEQGFASYFESQQWTDLPPWLGLCACIGMYALPRFAMPKTKERAKGFKNWIADKYITWKANRAKKRYARDNVSDPDIVRAEKAARRQFAVEREEAARAEAAAKL